MPTFTDTMQRIEDATAAAGHASWTPYGDWAPGEGASFESFSTLLTRVGSTTTYELGAEGDSSVTVLDTDLAFTWIYLTDSSWETYLGYIAAGEIGIGRETIHAPLDADEIAHLYWAIGDSAVILSEVSQAGKVSIGAVLDNDESFSSISHVFSSEYSRPLGVPATALGEDLTTMGYDEDETAQLIERFGFPTEGFESRYSATVDIVEDAINTLTHGLSTLAYDTRYINDEIQHNVPIASAEVSPITAAERDVGTGVNFSTSVTTTTSTDGAGASTSTTSATTTGTSGY